MDATTADGRSKTIDILRGLAIFTMVAANYSAPLLQPEAKTLWFRLYGSFAAPLFILLAGMMVAMTQARHGGIGHCLRRGAQVMACGCLVDVAIWGTYPFLGYDVLYLIGIAIPVVWLATRYCGLVARAQLAAALLVGGHGAQRLIGYRPELASPALGTLGWDGYLERLFSADTGQRLLVDGWFPLLPWLAVAIVGSIAGTLYQQGRLSPSRATLGGGLLALLAGVALWRWQNPALAVRDGYSELFYPPSLGYMLTAFGLITLLFHWVERGQQAPALRPLSALGHASLFMYLFHQLVLVAVLSPAMAGQRLPLPAFLFVYACAASLMVAIGYALARLKRRVKRLPYGLRFLLGS